MAVADCVRICPGGPLLDGRSVAGAEIHDDEKAVTAIALLQRAVSRFAARGVTVERVLSDNVPAYKSFAWRDTRTELHIVHA